MSAPSGNQFWKLRAKHGRDHLYSSPDDLWAACVEYFEWVHENPLVEMRPFAYQGEVIQEPVAKMRAMTITGLCFYLNIDDRTWRTWKDREDLLPIITRVEQVIYEQKFTGAAAELLNPNIIARDLGLKDASSHEHTSPDGSMTPKPAIDVSKLSTSALSEILAAQEQSE